jgi:hypothetical protein
MMVVVGVKNLVVGVLCHFLQQLVVVELVVVELAVVADYYYYLYFVSLRTLVAVVLFELASLNLYFAHVAVPHFLHLITDPRYTPPMLVLHLLLSRGPLQTVSLQLLCRHRCLLRYHTSRHHQLRQSQLNLVLPFGY